MWWFVSLSAHARVLNGSGLAILGDSNLAPPPPPRVYQYVREQRPDALVCVMALFPRADPEDKSSPYPWPGINEASTIERPLPSGYYTVLIIITSH